MTPCIFYMRTFYALRLVINMTRTKHRTKTKKTSGTAKDAGKEVHEQKISKKMQAEDERVKKIVTLVAALVVVAIVAVFLFKPDTPVENMDAFAKCLSNNDATMYGAVWCSHCNSQKKDFGDAFQYINYVECPANPDLCTEKDIPGFPTWIIRGEQHVGKQSLTELSKLTGCEL